MFRLYLVTTLQRAKKLNQKIVPLTSESDNVIQALKSLEELLEQLEHKVTDMVNGKGTLDATMGRLLSDTLTVHKNDPAALQHHLKHLEASLILTGYTQQLTQLIK